MVQGPSSAVLGRVASLYGAGSVAGLGDGQLLDRFGGGPADEAEAAFAALVDRHAPAVLYACRRILGDRHDAEDAAQATFLVLARQARSIRRVDSIAGWLCGVATRIAARSRREAGRRRGRERRYAVASPASASATAGGELLASEAARALHEELGRLPERFRLPVVLCHLEGLTYEQAAGRIGCPVRTVQSRLDRARRRLRDRLARRGLALPPGAIPAVLAPDPSVVTPASWRSITIGAAVRPAEGGVGPVVVSSRVIALAQGVSRTMSCHRWMKCVALSSVIAAAGGAGVVGLGQAPPTAPTPATPPAERPAPPDPDRYRVAVGNGASVEVVAVSTLPSGPETWWRPDGTRLAVAPVDRIMPRSNAREGEVARVVLVRSEGIGKDDFFRWHPTPTWSFGDDHPKRGGKDAPGLEVYEAIFTPDLDECGVEARVAAGEWRTEATNDGRGGYAEFVNGHKFTYGKARAYARGGRTMTVFSVAHNFLEQDRRLVAIGRDGTRHPAFWYSMGSDGDAKWLIDLIDGEFLLAPDQIAAFDVQFRPITKVQIGHIALNPAR